MDMKELDITIDREGRVRVAVRGGHGEDCIDLTRKIEEAVGVVEERALLPEYYEQAADVHTGETLRRY
ncbi:MAG: DUF2997 domain-containing protein [Methanoregula sp.]|jgi:hypothetical protein|uniref:DUF2997 domain-containing protein n=1 Tax=Methanoregula sp. TaxID=2052170 RepID=UPI003D149ACC